MVGLGVDQCQILGWSKQARTSCSSWLGLVGLLWSGGRPPEELNLFVFLCSNKTAWHSTADANILATVVECVRVGRFSNNREWGDWRSMLIKCVSLWYWNHTALWSIFTHPIQCAQTQKIFQAVSCQWIPYDWALSFPLQSRSPHKKRNFIFCQKCVRGLGGQCNCQGKLMSINSHSSLFPSHTHAHKAPASNLQRHKSETYSTA